MAVVKILAWDQLLNISYAGLNHLSDNGGPYSLSKESLDVIFLKFFMHSMPTTDVIGVVNSLDKDQILDFKTSCFFL